MTNQEVYKIWAPDGEEWTKWAKPVIFMNDMVPSPGTNFNFESEKIAKEYDARTIVIVDLPDEKSVKVALQYAKKGYRPVPIYNGVAPDKKAKGIIDCTKLVSALYLGTGYLAQITINKDAPAVFMLDSNRMSTDVKIPGYFDNRWSIFPQDMPSSLYLKKNGIKKVVVHSDKIREDLSHILFKYQQDGIEVFLHEKEKKITKPSLFHSTLYRLRVMLGLKRNSAGGFGGKIPDPNSGGRAYGIG